MTTVYESTLPPSTAQLHVLAIGVGDYPEIAKHRANPNCPPLTNLDAPPASVKRLADWLLANENDLQLPLGSIEAVTAAPVSIQTVHGTETTSGASLLDIQLAFEKWYTRCDRNAGNIAIFYFCGHGLTAGVYSTLLLPSDFFIVPQSPFHNCILFESTMFAMAANKACCQLYLVDCCRTAPDNYQPVFPASAGVALKELMPGDLPLSHRCSVALYATKNGAEAFAPTSASPTPFVELVLEGIERGTCASRGIQRWFVSPWSLVNKAQTLADLQRRRANSGLPLDPQMTVVPSFFDRLLDKDLRQLAAPPLVHTKVYLLNGLSNSASSVVFEQNGTILETVTRAQWTAPDEIDTVIPGGEVNIFVSAPPLGGSQPFRCYVEPAQTIIPLS